MTILAKDDIDALFSSNVIKGLTPGKGSHLVKIFGEQALNAIMDGEAQARSTLGSAFEKTQEHLEELRDDWELLAWLAKNKAASGFSHAVVKFRRISDHPFAMSAVMFLDAIRGNPYLLTNASGIGFKKADAFAIKTGIQPDDELRLLACAEAAIQKSCHDTGGGAFYGVVKNLIHGFISDNKNVAGMNTDKLVQKSMELGFLKKIMREGLDENKEKIIFSEEFMKDEENCAIHLLRMSTQASPYKSVNLKKSLKKSQKEMGFDLNESQGQAINVVMQGRLAIIAGKPGAGKTTLLKCVAPFLETDHRSVLYAAPTGKAASRMSESMNREAVTIHRLLGIGKKNPVEIQEIKDQLRSANAVVIDEASMVDVHLMSKLLNAIGPKTLLLMVGDPGQLPSVGPGKVLDDLIKSKTFPTAVLDQVVRQKKDSLIVQVSNKIDQQDPEAFSLSHSNIEDNNFFFRDTSTDLVGQKIIMYLKNAKKHHEERGENFNPLIDAQILTSTNGRETGAINLNRKIQEIFNPYSESKKEIIFKKTKEKDSDELVDVILRVGDKVMQTTNRPSKPLFDALPPENSKANESSDGSGLANGDVGFIERIDDYKKIWVKFDNRYAELSLEEARELSHAYAVTVHKFQGSESPIIIFAMSEKTRVLNKNLIYTAITRAKKTCVVLGSIERLKEAIVIDAVASRRTRLKGLINGEICPESLPDDVRIIYEQKVKTPTPSVVASEEAKILLGIVNEKIQTSSTRPSRTPV